VKVNTQLTVKGAKYPKYGSAGAAGADLYAAEELLIPHSGGLFLVRTGVSVEIPEGYAGFIQPRSGLALNEHVTVLNSPGLIDSDYRGELKVLLINHHTFNNYRVRVGDRIAQLVIQKVERCDFVAEKLTETERGTDGFGSTGTK
jgi:dUTP pyrophosphatase